MTPDNLASHSRAGELDSRIAAGIRLPAASTLLSIALLCLSLLTYKIAHRALYEVGHYGSDIEAFGVVALSCAVACLFASIRYSDIPWLLRVVVRGIGAFILVLVRRRFALCWALGVAVVLGSLGTPARAAVISAPSGLAADIQAAVNLAKTGDIVTIPAGTFHFVGQVFAPDGIYIKGAGRDSTYLIKSDDLSEWQGMFTIDAKTGQPFKFSGITLVGRLTALQGTNRTAVSTTVKDQGLVIYGAAKNVQIFGSRFTNFLRAGIEFRGDAGSVPGEPNGVIYDNEFIDNWYIYLGYGVAIDGSAKSWHREVRLGSSNAMFVEDNHFDRNRHCVTSSDGGVYVARYNTVVDSYQDASSFDAHGLSPAWPRGTRAVEIYRNTVNNSITRWAGASIRGGSGVVWGNSWNGVRHGIDLVLERPPSTHPLTTYPALDQIGNPDGLFIWDNVSSGDDIYKRPTPDPHGIDYWLRENRDYWLMVKPGYVPYTYPHPLRTGRLP